MKKIISLLSALLIVINSHPYDMTPGIIDLSDAQLKKQLHNKPITVFVPGTASIIKGASLFFTTRPNGLGFGKDMEKPFQSKVIGLFLEQADQALYPNPNDPNRRFYFDNYFVHGWDGQLNKTIRKDESRKLYRQLARVNRLFKEKFGNWPKITIVTFSHGGNIALNMAIIKTEEEFIKNTAKDLLKTDLVLIACPIQEATRELVGDTLFTRAYSLYSRNDTVQILDPQGIFIAIEDGNFISERFFFSAPDNLAQLEILPNKNMIEHTDFARAANIGFIPKIIQLADAKREELASDHLLARIDIVYGHIEKTTITVLPTVVGQG